jgi:hypothetical protein
MSSHYARIVPRHYDETKTLLYAIHLIGLIGSDGEQKPLSVALKDRLTWTAKEAAIMCGISVKRFNKWVENGLMPLPMPGTKHYNAYAVRNALVSMTASGDVIVDPLEQWRATQS